MIALGVNIDHVATLRQARYRDCIESALVEPSPVQAALAAEAAGADGITAHLREDRRHIQDADIHLLRERIQTKLNLEMGNSEDVLRIALSVRPDEVCLVPENRREVTTEGGLDCCSEFTALLETVAKLRDAGIRVSLFIDPDRFQVEAAKRLSGDIVELHTGAFANADSAGVEHEFGRLRVAAELAHEHGLQVNAGHGINYVNIERLRLLPHLRELNIGHSIISRAVFSGLEAAVSEMRRLMNVV